MPTSATRRRARGPSGSTGSTGSARLAYVALAVLCALGVGCRAREGRAHRCTCSFLSDYDDDWEHTLVACGDSPEHAAAVARGCAQASAPAPIQHCRCEPAPELPPCKNETCDEAKASGGFVKK